MLILIGYVLLGLFYLLFTYLAISVRNEGVKLKHAENTKKELFSDRKLKI